MQINRYDTSNNTNQNIDNIDTMIVQNLYANKSFTAAVFAKTICPFLYSKSIINQGYGKHVDNAFMGTDFIIRADISCTVFVSDMNDYEGGELIIEDKVYKGKRGSAIIYPSNTLHEVSLVKSGQRNVCVTWLQSLIKDPTQRQILFDLDRCRQKLFKLSEHQKEFDLLSKSYMNLLRIWGEV